MQVDIAENVAAVRQEIIRAAKAAGRDPGEIRLCAATKMNDAEAVRQAIRAGITDCGENRVQELTEKLSQNAYDGASIHFIGHLQTNKVRQVVGKVDLIQSVDSMHLLEKINQEAARQGICQNILLEINIANEASKSGFALEEIPGVLENLGPFSNICMKGFMTIPPISRFSGDNLKFFRKIQHFYVDIRRKKYDNVAVDCLSMGMSGDYPDAIACGSTMVRVGTAIFGPRNYTATRQA